MLTNQETVTNADDRLAKETKRLRDDANQGKTAGGGLVERASPRGNAIQQVAATARDCKRKAGRQS